MVTRRHCGDAAGERGSLGRGPLALSGMDREGPTKRGASRMVVGTRKAEVVVGLVADQY